MILYCFQQVLTNQLSITFVCLFYIATLPVKETICFEMYLVPKNASTFYFIERNYDINEALAPFITQINNEPYFERCLDPDRYRPNISSIESFFFNKIQKN